MSIKVNLDFIKESKELLDGVERLTRLIEEFEITNILIYQVEDRAEAKVTYDTQDDRNSFICKIHKGNLEHYFDVDLGWSVGSIYGSVGDYGWTPDQVLYLKYGNQNLYIVEKEGIFDEVGTTFSETELREWFKEYWESDPSIDSDDFDEWLKVTAKNGYLKMYILFDTNVCEELNRLFGGN